MIEKKLDKKNYKVTFLLDKGDFSEFDDIRVLGDFNGWHYEKGLIMDFKKNKFKASISLKAGQSYEFRYILNGRHWFNDPAADGLVDSPFYGISNTLIVLEGKKESSKKEKSPSKTSKKNTPSAKETKAVSKVPAKAAAAPKTTKTAAPAAPKAAAAPKTTKTAAPAAPKTVTAAKKVSTEKKTGDDLKIIEGIGPKIADLLIKNGITTFAQLSETKVDKIEAILTSGGPSFALADPGTWPAQSKLAAEGKMDELKKLQDSLKGGR